MDIPYLNDKWVKKYTSYPELVNVLQQAFTDHDIHVPMRQHYEIGNKYQGTLLTMPSWKTDDCIGVKLVNVFPENPLNNLPSIQGVYVHFDGKTGEPKCLIDAKSLTNKRTAAASALASKYLSRKDSNTLLMIGTGSLAPELIKAHASVRPIKEVYVWGRNHEKVKSICLELHDDQFKCVAVKHKEEWMGQVDIISTATMASEPVVFGKLVRQDSHVDLVGSYKPDMREADDDLISVCKIFVDTIPGATKESGDLVIPLSEGTISHRDIISDLHQLCSRRKKGRNSKDEITLFKSVGYALEDLAAGQYMYEKYLLNK